MINGKVYTAIALVFLVIFFLFMFSTVSGDNLAGYYDNRRGEIAPEAGPPLLREAFWMEAQRTDAPEDWVLDNPKAAIIASSQPDAVTDTLQEWCVYNKYRYRVFTGLPEVGEISDYDVLLFNDPGITAQDVVTLKLYAQTGIPMVFVRLPTYEQLASSTWLSDFFGIERCVSPGYGLDGVKVFADFFLSKERIYTHDDFYGQEDDMAVRVPYYTLRTGYEVFAVAILDDQSELGIKNEELPPLLWRTYTGASDVFAVNGELFSGDGLLGVVTGFLSQASPVYLYPVVNAQTIVLVNYPYFLDENREALMELYSRDALGFSRDIVWPTVVKIVAHYDAPFNFCVPSQLEYGDGSAPADDDVVLYWKEINKLSGSVGLSLGQVSDVPLETVLEESAAFFGRVLPDYRFTALYAGAFPADKVGECLASGRFGLLDQVRFVFFPYGGEDRLFTVLDGDVLAVRSTADGFRHEAKDDLEMIALETALGLCTQEVDMARALYPRTEEDGWSRLSREWSEGKTYYADFEAFDAVSTEELEARSRAFLAMDFSYAVSPDSLDMRIDSFAGDAWFILKVHLAEVAGVAGGSAAKLTDTAYLIHAEEANVRIDLRPKHRAPLAG